MEQEPNIYLTSMQNLNQGLDFSSTNNQDLGITMVKIPSLMNQEKFPAKEALHVRKRSRVKIEMIIEMVFPV